MNTFNRKRFIASAEAYLLSRLQKWLEGIRGTPLEPIVLKLARQDWILETENLEAITVWNIFRDVDLKAIAGDIEAGRTSEKEAKYHIAGVANRNLKDIADELQRLEDSNPPALKGNNPADPGDLKAKAILEAEAKAKAFNPGDVLLIGDEPASDPPLSGEVRGYVAEVKSSPRIQHTIEIDGHRLYTFDKSLAETAKSAKSQNMHALMHWTVGEFGCRLENIKFLDPPKLIEEIIP